MKSLSGVGLGLSLVFGCLLLALVAELYYLLWWKKRIVNGGIEDGYIRRRTTEFFCKSCWRKPSSLRNATFNPQDLCSSDTQVHEPQVQFHGDSNKDLWYKSFGEDGVDDDELMRLQNIAGPPRFLFTIKEETKEDMESEDGKSRDRSRRGSRSRSLSEVFHIVETPYLTPIASPPYFTPPLTPVRTSYSSFFGSASEAEFNWLGSSPPPNFQFLRAAEDKLHKRKFTAKEVEIDEGFHRNDESTSVFHKINDEENGSFITLIVDRNREEQLHNDLLHNQNLPQYTPNTSQVHPLASSPPRTPKLTSSNKSILHQNLHQMNN